MNKTIKKIACLACILALVGVRVNHGMNNVPPHEQEDQDREHRRIMRHEGLGNLYRQYHMDVSPGDRPGESEQLAIRGAAPLPNTAWNAFADLLTEPGAAAPFITNIYFNGSDITDGLPPAFGRFVNVRILSIIGGIFDNHACAITAANAPRNIANIAFVNTQITELPAALARLPIRYIWLNGSPVQRLAPTIGEWHQLDELWLAATAINDETLAEALAIASATITLINLSHTAITAIPAHIARLVNLESLNLAGTAVMRLPEQIGTLPRLHSIDLSASTMNDDDLHAIVAVLPRSITNINISRCPNIHHLPDNLVRLPLLTALNITDTQVVGVPTREEMPQLRRIMSSNPTQVRLEWR